MTNIDVKAVALIAAGSAAVTYLITKHQFKKKATLERRERYEHDQKVRFAEDEERKDKGLPSGIKLDDVHPDSVYLWDVERLDKYFPSEGAGVKNIMSALAGKGMDDRRAKYNKLIGEHECILANIRRSPGKVEETR